ncbi:hypothetical protein PI124_g16555 [Phytophthora idaei]|nr:hypothetical protein PI124_g16555 [Phytophthora idaei]
MDGLYVIGSALMDAAAGTSSSSRPRSQSELLLEYSFDDESSLESRSDEDEYSL